MADTAQKLQLFITEHLTAEEAEHLVGWIAWRVQRPASLAGPDTPSRIERALSWCSPAQQLALLTWLRQRDVDGGSYSPGR